MSYLIKDKDGEFVFSDPPEFTDEELLEILEKSHAPDDGCTYLAEIESDILYEIAKRWRKAKVEAKVKVKA